MEVTLHVSYHRCCRDTGKKKKKEMLGGFKKKSKEEQNVTNIILTNVK